MIDPWLVALGGLLGAGGLAGVVAAWRKSIPEATDIGVGTQERIFSMANEIIDTLREELAVRLASIEVLDKRILDLQGEVKSLQREINRLIELLESHGLPWDGGMRGNE